MNEQNPGAEPLESSPLNMSYRDRSTGLMVFGILTILLGCLSGLLVPLMLFGQAMAAASTHAPQLNFSLILPAILIYGGLAVALVWLGIGSIMAKRWARALLLIFSWSWLVMGILDMVVMAVIMPKVLANLPSTGTAGHPAPNPAIMDGVMFMIFVVDGFILVLLPAIWTFFYKSRHVKASCEARNPAPSWTDACPLPVLAVCLWAMFSAPMMMIMPVAFHGVTPFFGIFLRGVAGMVFYLAIAAVWSCAAWLLYKLDLRGWWLIFITMCVMMVSGVITFARHDVIEMYRLMDYPEAQIQQIQKSGVLEGNTMTWMMAFFMVPFLGYLIFIKRYFRPKS